jgi:hypothetical protein
MALVIFSKNLEKKLSNGRVNQRPENGKSPQLSVDRIRPFLLIDICGCKIKFGTVHCILGYILRGRGGTQSVEALRYKPEGRGFDSRWCHWNFSLT